MKRPVGTALLLNAEVCLRVREGSQYHVVLDVLVIDAAASGVTWLLTLEVGEGLPVWTTTGKAQVVFLGIHGDTYLFTVSASPSVVVRREEDCATLPWGIPHSRLALTCAQRPVGVSA